MTDPLYSLRGASFAIGGANLLQPLDLELPPGRIAALVGHNGSGKSTLLKLLARQQPPSSGEIDFDGAPIASLSDRAFARRVAYLPQATAPAAGMLARELVALGRYPWRGALGRLRGEDRAKIDEAMALADVERFADRLVDTLSGGERQRVWLAMLIAQDAKCLLLDEPTSALDIVHQVETLGLVRRLSHEKGLGVVLVLHDVNLAARFADEIVALKSGRLVARGAPDALMRAETLREIFGLEMEVIRQPASGRLAALAR